MAQAPRDENRVTVLLGVSAIDGVTPIVVYVDDATNRLKVDAILSSGDIQIGAIEIKDGDSDTRADVESDGTKNALFVQKTPLKGINGAPVTVGTSAVEMTFSNTTKSLALLSDHDNTGKVWWGGSNIDNTGANALGRLAAGQAVNIDFDDSTTAIYTVSDTAGQKVYKVALT